MSTVTLEQCKQAFSDGALGHNCPTNPTLLDYWLSAAQGGTAMFLDKDYLEGGYPVCDSDSASDDDDYFGYDDDDDDDDF